jgi:hypothetical protein
MDSNTKLLMSVILGEDVKLRDPNKHTSNVNDKKENFFNRIKEKYNYFDVRKNKNFYSYCSYLLDREYTDNKLTGDRFINNEEGKRRELFSIMNNIIFITSLTFSDLYDNDVKFNRGVKYKNVIASTSFFSAGLYIDEMVEKLSAKYIYSYDIFIINVSWLNTYKIGVVPKTYNCKNVFGTEFKVNYIAMGYTTFFKYIKKISICRSNLEKEDKSFIGLNPIIIFRGLHWGNIVYLFELHNIKLHGGSITNRHKLSIAEYRLG